jgi:hypothetical protein
MDYVAADDFYKVKIIFSVAVHFYFIRYYTFDLVYK